MPKLSIVFIQIFLLLCGFSCPIRAQEDTVIRSVITLLADRLPDLADLSELTVRLSFYQDHPIDLNKAKPAQLKDLVFLSPLQIHQFFTHTLDNGKMTDLLELQGIDGFDLETISLLLPFVTLRPQAAFTQLSLNRILFNGQHELIIRYGQVLEKQKGYRDLPGNRYLGSPAKLLLRYHYHLDDRISFSLTGEKDAGEMFLKGNNKSGFDFLSGSLAFYKNGRFSKIILGDYGIQFGQGLTLWTGAFFGKGADVSGVAKNGTGLRTYTSANESTFFRGIGSEFKLLKNISLTTFISSKNLDASLNTSSDGKKSLTVINTSGLHRTATEINRKHNLHQLLYGMLLGFETERLNLGFAAYHSRYGHPFKGGEQLYKKYALEGTELSNLGFHYSYTFKNTYIFGEVAHSLPGGSAFLNGAMASLLPKLSIVILHRDYGKEYLNFYSQGIGEGSAAANEKGIYAGIHYTPSRKWDFSVYNDIFHFPWAKYRVDQPSSGSQLMLQGIYNPKKNTKIILKASSKSGEQNEGSGLAVNPVVKLRKYNGRAELQWKLNRQFNLSNRVEITRYKKGNRAAENGYLIYQDLDYKPMSSRLAANLRMAWFDTPSYDTRIYAYEDDVLHGSGSGLYYGKGIRSYINCSYRWSRQLRIWFRYALSYFPGEDKIGTYLEEINGSKKSDLKLQLRYQF